MAKGGPRAGTQGHGPQWVASHAEAGVFKKNGLKKIHPICLSRPLVRVERWGGGAEALGQIVLYILYTCKGLSGDSNDSSSGGKWAGGAGRTRSLGAPLHSLGRLTVRTGMV